MTLREPVNKVEGIVVGAFFENDTMYYVYENHGYIGIISSEDKDSESLDKTTFHKLLKADV